MSDYKLFHVDDCMYVAAASEDEARKHVQDECGEECGEEVNEAHLHLNIETANVDDGETPTEASGRTAQQLIDEHLHFGGKLPWTVAYNDI